jgi:hypothetical protein
MNHANHRSAQITADDRAWFIRHPEALVRFRPIRAQELEQLKINGIEPPEFRPSWCKPSAALQQIAVIDLTRLLQSRHINTLAKEVIRIRIATPKARSKSAKVALHNELIEAICQELIILVGQESSASQAKRGDEPKKLAA